MTEKDDQGRRLASTKSLAMDYASKVVPGLDRLWQDSGDALNEASALEAAGKSDEALAKIYWARGVQHAISVVIDLNLPPTPVRQ